MAVSIRKGRLEVPTGSFCFEGGSFVKAEENEGGERPLLLKEKREEEQKRAKQRKEE